MKSLEALADHYTVERATVSKQASGEAHLLILRDKNQVKHFAWSHNGIWFSEPEPIDDKKRHTRKVCPKRNR